MVWQEREQKKGELIFAVHTNEFNEFYDWHRRICDEISGMKIRTVGEVDHPDRVIINRSNFHHAIKRVNAFLLYNFHAISDRTKKTRVLNAFRSLETDFYNDELYLKFSQKQNENGDLTINQEAEFNKKYLIYIVRCFEIIYMYGMALRSSMLPSPAEIIKTVSFMDYKGFFYNLTQYRFEVSSNLSNFKFKNIYEHFKKIMGYFYTYRYVMNDQDNKNAYYLIQQVYNYLTIDEVCKDIIKIKQGGDLTLSFKLKIEERSQLMKETLGSVFLIVNKSLSLKNILPKTIQLVKIDKTLI